MFQNEQREEYIKKRSGTIVLNDGNKLDEDGRTRQEIPQTTCRKAGA